VVLGSQLGMIASGDEISLVTRLCPSVIGLHVCASEAIKSLMVTRLYSSDAYEYLDCFRRCEEPMGWLRLVGSFK